MMVKTLIARDFQKDIDIREEAIRDNDLSRIKAIREDLMGAVSQKFPTGRWLIHHDPSAFDNDEGQSPLTEVFQPDLLCAFDKPGKYEILFDNEKVKEVYVHRKPVADFNIGIQDGIVTLTSIAYDLDSNEDAGYGKGIAKEEWFYKKAEEENWTSGKLNRLTANEVYIIKQKVTDKQGASSETIKYVGIGAPVSNFGLSSNAISTADHLQVQDYSYDPQGYNLTGYEWVLKKGNTVVNTYTTKEFPDVDFNGSGLGEGEYSLSLKVTNTAGDSSGVFTQTFKVDTARYSNQFIHYAAGFEKNEGNSDEGARFLLQKTYATQTYGTTFVPSSRALAVPNGFYLEAQYSMEDQKYDVNASVTQPGNGLVLVYQYLPYEYTVEYDLDGGILEEENVSSYSVLYGAPLYTPQKEHHTFLGWYDQNGNRHESLNEGVVNNFSNTADFYSKLAGRTTGNLKLTAKWEYRVYQITGSKYGHGTITRGGAVGEGEEIAITWTPDEGYEVTRVMVDGTVRDDLLNGGAGNTITFSNVSSDHTVRAEFAKIQEEDPDEEVKEYFTVSTEQRGGSKEAVISNSRTLLKGSDYVVEWQPGEMDEILSITVDGQDYPIDRRNVEFKQLSGDHTVIVVYKEKEETPSMPTTDGYYTITVSSLNGDAKRIDTFVSGSAVVIPSENHTVRWNAQNGYQVSAIWIDRGTESELSLSEEEITAGSYAFSNISSDHVVEVVFKKDGEPQDPDDTKKQVTINTELVGGPGQITGSATLYEGEDYTIQWDSSVKTTEDVDSPDYAVYKVSEVFVNGEAVEAEKNNVELKEIKENQTVRVVMEPVLYQVETQIVGEGTIAPTTTLFDGQNYSVQATPKEGWVLKSVIVDDQPQYENPGIQTIQNEEPSLEDEPVYDEDEAGGSDISEMNEDSEPEASSEMLEAPMLFALPRANGEIVVNIQDQEEVPVNVQVSGITQNHKIRVEFMQEDGTQVDTTDHLNVNGKIAGGPGVFIGGGSYEPGSQAVLSWNAPEGYEVSAVTVKVNGVQRNDFEIKDNTLQLNDIQDNYDIEVSLKKSGGSSTPSVPGTENKKWSVLTKITNGEGEITQTTHELENGSNWTVSWNFDGDQFTVKEVRIDGITDDSYLNANQILFENLASDHSVEIILAPKKPSSITDNKKDQYLISTERTQGGTIDPSVRVNQGMDQVIAWEAEAGYVVASVTVDGTRRKDLLDAGSVQFQNISQDHHVAVVFAKEGESKPNVDDLYSIATKIGEGEGYIDSSVNVLPGTNHVVKWIPAEGYEVKSVILDGNVRDDLKGTTQMEFENIQQNHSVAVLFQKIESKDQEGVTDLPDESFRIETSREGKGTVSLSAVVAKGETYIASWVPAEGYKVGRIEIDGVVCPELLNVNSVELKNIGANHRISVIFDRIDGIQPDYKDFVYIATKVSGGFGEITGSFAAEKGESAVVEWQPKEGYVVSKVYVNGQEVSTSGNSLVLNSVDHDYEVEVVLTQRREVPSASVVPVVNTGDPSQTGLILIAMMLSLIQLIWIGIRHRSVENVK